MKTEKIRGLIGLARRARQLTTGSRETRAGLRRGEVRLVLLAADGSPRDRERLVRAAEEGNAPTRIVGTREELGGWVGRGSVAVCGVLDANLASEIRLQIDREDGGSRGARRNNGGQKS
ncbi:MAG: hypothetical protein HKN12_09250 [Gemmatimonadetes bacterium]|nr:hypothetical protein [Gemmatimonadota bacterium]